MQIHRGIQPPGQFGVISASGSKTKILYFASPVTAKKGSYDLSKGEVNKKPFLQQVDSRQAVREFIDKRIAY